MSYYLKEPLFPSSKTFSKAFANIPLRQYFTGGGSILPSKLEFISIEARPLVDNFVEQYLESSNFIDARALRIVCFSIEINGKSGRDYFLIVAKHDAILSCLQSMEEYTHQFGIPAYSGDWVSIKFLKKHDPVALLIEWKILAEENNSLKTNFRTIFVGETYRGRGLMKKICLNIMLLLQHFYGGQHIAEIFPYHIATYRLFFPAKNLLSSDPVDFSTQCYRRAILDILQAHQYSYTIYQMAFDFMCGDVRVIL